MTPHKAAHGKGSFMVDRVFAGVGRIQRASGTTDKRTFRGINGMLDELFIKGLHGQLAAIRDGLVKPVAAYHLYRTTSAEQMPDVPALATVKAPWAAWETATPNAATQRQRKFAGKHLQAALADRAPIAALPGAVRALRASLVMHPPAYNRILAAAQAFVRDTLGDRHSVYDQVTAVGRLKERPTKRPAPSVETAIRVRDALPATEKAVWWSMYTTGMNPLEYDGRWDVLADRVAVHGTKRSSRERVVPLVAAPARRGMGWKQYRRELAKYALQVNDARRGFRHLCEEARIPRTRIRQLMGHRIADVTDGYGQVELSEFLAVDAAAIQAVIARTETTLRDAQKQGMRSA